MTTELSQEALTTSGDNSPIHTGEISGPTSILPNDDISGPTSNFSNDDISGPTSNFSNDSISGPTSQNVDASGLTLDNPIEPIFAPSMLSLEIAANLQNSASMNISTFLPANNAENLSSHSVENFVDLLFTAPNVNEISTEITLPSKNWENRGGNGPSTSRQ